jgi:hypothetical protein
MTADLCQRQQIDGRACDNDADDEGGTFNGHPICFACLEDLEDRGVINEDDPEHQDLEAKFQREIVFQAVLWWNDETGGRAHSRTETESRYDPVFLAFAAEHADPDGWFMQMCADRVTDPDYKWYAVNFAALSRSGVWPLGGAA